MEDLCLEIPGGPINGQKIVPVGKKDGLLDVLGLFFGFVCEYFFDRDPEVPCNPEGEVQGWNVFSFLNSENRLTVDANHLRQVILG